MSGSGSTQQFLGSDQIQIVPYSLVSGPAGNSLNGLRSLFPFLSSSGTINVAFNNSAFHNFLFVGTTQILGQFITTSQNFQADANFDFTVAGSATVNFNDLGAGIFTKLSDFGLVQSANYLISYMNGASLSADFAEASTTTNVQFSLLSATFTIGVKATFDAPAPASTTPSISSARRSPARSFSASPWR